VRDFHTENREYSRTADVNFSRFACKTPYLAKELAKLPARFAPNPVMMMWTGCTRLKIRVLTTRDFRLTFFLEGVEQDRSLTAS